MHVVCHSQTFSSVALRSTCVIEHVYKRIPPICFIHSCLYINCRGILQPLPWHVQNVQQCRYFPSQLKSKTQPMGLSRDPNVLSFSLEILKQPKKMVSKMSALGLKHVGPVGMGVGAWGKHGFFFKGTRLGGLREIWKQFGCLTTSKICYIFLGVVFGSNCSGMIAPTKLEKLFNFKETSSEWRLRVVALFWPVVLSHRRWTASWTPLILKDTISQGVA